MSPQLSQLSCLAIALQEEGARKQAATTSATATQLQCEQANKEEAPAVWLQDPAVPEIEHASPSAAAATADPSGLEGSGTAPKRQALEELLQGAEVEGADATLTQQMARVR